MKLMIKHRYFKQIKAGDKEVEFRDAHITFVDELTGMTLVKEVVNVWMIEKHKLPKPLDGSSLFTDDKQIAFELNTNVSNRK